MRFQLTRLSDLAQGPFDTVIDARSPSEFALDHIPGAINLPVLDDAERERVGTIYVQESAFKAKKIGAALVARNVARHLDESLADNDGSWQPLVYCWRGGQRSGSFATILQQVGWRAQVVNGGYQSYRRLVKEALYDAPFPSRVVLLDGNTGSAKTDILPRLSARGVQVIDLEGLANHRGSLFGARSGGQPSQKAFEGALAQIITELDPTRPVVIEAESSRVGARIVPPNLWAAMKAAPRIEIQAPLEARARYLVSAYVDVVEDQARLANTLKKLGRYQSAETIKRWQALAGAGDLRTLASELMAQHYDTRYSKARAAREDITPLPVEALEPANLDEIAARIAAMI